MAGMLDWETDRPADCLVLTFKTLFVDLDIRT
ncbi:MAG: hypothetical protein V7631_413 [Massilia sp.]|jgi:hypothetical protein